MMAHPAKMINNKPYCPKCGQVVEGIHDHGVDGEGFWFKWDCPTCTRKNNRHYIKWYKEEWS